MTQKVGVRDQCWLAQASATKRLAKATVTLRVPEKKSVGIGFPPAKHLQLPVPEVTVTSRSSGACAKGMSAIEAGVETRQT